MTDQTNAELIAFTREEIEGLRRMGEHDWADALEGMMDALEAADQLAEIRGETIRTYERENADWERRVHIAERERDEARLQEASLREDVGILVRERDSAMASYKDYMRVRRERDALAAVVEKVRVRLTTDLDVNDESHVPDALDILATAPANALRELKADVWDEGVNAEARAAVTASPRIKNPYRAREEQNHG